MKSRGGIAALYTEPLPEEVWAALERAVQGRRLRIFFRADDIGIPDAGFYRMTRLFENYRVPLCLAVVPTWLNQENWQEIRKRLDVRDTRQWCWHQHGYAHVNHARSGKKNEFGPDRSSLEIERDVVRGKERLQEILGEIFCPVFTPPWNRCGESTLHLLAKAGFQAVSRSRGARPSSILPDIQINVDLHTNRQPDMEGCLRRLLDDWHQAVSDGYLGIMLHHQLMNEHAFVALERLLDLLGRQERALLCTFSQLLRDGLSPDG